MEESKEDEGRTENERQKGRREDCINEDLKALERKEVEATEEEGDTHRKRKARLRYKFLSIYILSSQGGANHFFFVSFPFFMPAAQLTRYLPF